MPAVLQRLQDPFVPCRQKALAALAATLPDYDPIETAVKLMPGARAQRAGAALPRRPAAGPANAAPGADRAILCGGCFYCCVFYIQPGRDANLQRDLI